MDKVINEMPPVSRCDVDRCTYNVNQACHAKAITIGDFNNPGCDTYFENNQHNKETKRMAGVGACKVDECQYNKDFECMAAKIVVGFKTAKINCLTFKP